MTDLTLTTERTIMAPQAAVFDAWLNPDMLKRFMTPAAGMTVPHAQTDPKEGGRFDLIMQGSDAQIPHAGTYKEITRYERIVFTWESPYSTDGSEVTLTFAPKDGGTHVTLDHIRFVDAEARDNHMGGWTMILSTLDDAICA